MLVILFIAFTNFGFSDSNTKNRKQDYSTSQLFREKHIDITVTSTGGCIFHVVGTLEYTIIPPRILGFTGTLTIGGPSNCPHQNFNINYVSLNTSEGTQTSGKKAGDGVDLVFNTDVLCDLSAATWTASSQSESDIINYSGVSEKLIEEIKEGDCN